MYHKSSYLLPVRCYKWRPRWQKDFITCLALTVKTNEYRTGHESECESVCVYVMGLMTSSGHVVSVI